MNDNMEIGMLEGTTEEILAQGLIIAKRDMVSYVADLREGVEVQNIELFLKHQENNMMNLLSLLDKDVVLSMLDLVHEDTKKRLRK